MLQLKPRFVSLGTMQGKVSVTAWISFLGNYLDSFNNRLIFTQ